MSEPFCAAVVIPTCNRRDLLEQALRALAQQTHPSFEVIVVDDCSTDGTAEMVRRIAQELAEFNVRVIRNEAQRGANASRNVGANATEAPIIAYIDSDAIPEQQWLDRLLEPFKDDEIAAVTGLVLDPPPKNMYDRTFRGTHRVPEGDANRLAGTNMAVRRELLLKYGFDEDRAEPDLLPDGTPDTTVSGRGDEEGLYLMLRAAGFRVRATHGARVLHVHHYTRRSFFKQAHKGGRSAARLVYKFRLRPRLDMLPFLLAYLSLPLMFISTLLFVIPAMFFMAALAAIVWNDLARKAKSPADVLRTFPLLVAYYHVRLVGYTTEIARLVLTGTTCDGTKLARTDLSKLRRTSSP